MSGPFTGSGTFSSNDKSAALYEKQVSKLTHNFIIEPIFCF
jgi:hypothetical protein